MLLWAGILDLEMAVYHRQEQVDKGLSGRIAQVENGPVDVKHDTIYVLTGEGYVYAPRHPGI